MTFIARDAEGRICGAFLNPQLGFPEVEMDEAEPELIAYRAGRPFALTLAEKRGDLRAAVNAERDRRMRQPFGFVGKRFDYDDESQKRITGAGALAHIAITLGGKAPNDPRWHDSALTPATEDFAWIAADNSLMPMDAQTVIAFGQAAGAWESAHIFAARALKDAIEAASDEAALSSIDINSGWPE